MKIICVFLQSTLKTAKEGAFRKMGRMTKNKEKVFNEIMNSSVPLTAYEVNRALSDMSLTTVYRALDYLSKNGYVKSFSLGEFTYYYSAATHRHFFRCSKCGRLFPIEDCYMEDYEREISKRYGFEIEEHFILFSGLCQECREKLE